MIVRQTKIMLFKEYNAIQGIEIRIINKAQYSNVQFRFKYDVTLCTHPSSLLHKLLLALLLVPPPLGGVAVLLVVAVR